MKIIDTHGSWVLGCESGTVMILRDGQIQRAYNDADEAADHWWTISAKGLRGIIPGSADGSGIAGATLPSADFLEAA